RPHLAPVYAAPSVVRSHLVADQTRVEHQDGVRIRGRNVGTVTVGTDHDVASVASEIDRGQDGPPVAARNRERPGSVAAHVNAGTVGRDGEPRRLTANGQRRSHGAAREVDDGDAGAAEVGRITTLPVG